MAAALCLRSRLPIASAAAARSQRPWDRGRRAQICGALTFGYVIGIFVTIATLSPGTSEFRQNMDDLNRYMSQHRMARELRSRLREYFHQTRHLQDASNQRRLLGLMSPVLQVSEVR